MDANTLAKYLRRAMGGPTEGADTLLPLISGMAAEVPAGLAGLGSWVGSGFDPAKGAETVENVRNALTYTPRTEQGAANLQAISELPEKVGNVPLPSGHTVRETFAPAAAKWDQFSQEHPVLAAGGMAALAVADPTKIGRSIRSVGRGLGKAVVENAGRPVPRRVAQRGGVDLSAWEPEPPMTPPSTGVRGTTWEQPRPRQRHPPA